MSSNACIIHNSRGNNKPWITLSLQVSTPTRYNFVSYNNYCCCQDGLLQLHIDQQVKWLRLDEARIVVSFMLYCSYVAGLLDEFIIKVQDKSLAKRNTVFTLSLMEFLGCTNQSFKTKIHYVVSYWI